MNKEIEEMVKSMSRLSGKVLLLQRSGYKLREEDLYDLQDLACLANIVIERANEIAGYDLVENWKESWSK